MAGRFRRDSGTQHGRKFVVRLARTQRFTQVDLRREEQTGLQRPIRRQAQPRTASAKGTSHGGNDAY